jgi:hypothetical protein
MVQHNLKCDIRFFQNIVDGKIRAINRQNDRGYEVGDIIVLHEGYIDASAKDGFFYTGRTVAARISFIDTFGVQGGFVTLSLESVGLLII